MSEIVGVPDEPAAVAMSDKQLALQEQQRNTTVASPEPRTGGMKAITAQFKAQLGVDNADSGAESSEPSSRPSEVEEKSEVFVSKKAQDWRKLKSELQSQRLSASEYKQKYEALIRGTNGDTELSKIKAERDALDEQLRRIQLEKHPQFESRFSARLNESIQAAHAELGGKSPEPELRRLFELPAGVERDRILSEVRRLAGTAIAQGRFDAAVAAFDRTRAERDRALAQSKENLERAEQLQSLEEQRQLQMQHAQRESLIAQALSAAKDLPAFKRTGNPEHDKRVDMNIESVQRFFRNQLPAEQMVSYPLIVSEAKHLMETVVPSLAKENQELKAALQELRHTSAPLTGGSRRGDSEEKPRKTFVEAVTEGWRGMLKD